MKRAGCAWCIAALAALAAGAGAQERVRARDLTEISLEELLNVQVTSVSKKEQRLARVPAAIYVIGAEEIRRSGATSIPELLRMAPGVQVARIDANKWAISVRGFNGRWSNKLLVLIDGRSVYTPVFSGVFWEVQDTLLEDIERIEVIRGPGATMWGANAVNGVINVITRHARDTQGTLAAAGGGNEQLAFGALRHGGQAGRLAYRVYSKYFKRNHLATAEGGPGVDGWDGLRGGFRADWEGSRRDAVTVQGEVYRSEAGQRVQTYAVRAPFQTDFTDTARSGGGHVLGNWSHVFSGRSESTLRFYFDRAERGDALSRLAVDSYEAAWEHRLALGRRHDWQFGTEIRAISDGLEGRALGRFVPPARTQSLLSAYFQDEIQIVEGRLYLTVGSKFERNYYTGFEWQPGAQVLWAPDARNSIWASGARAVRTPSRAERDAHLLYGTGHTADGIPFVATVAGDAGFRSEELRAFEAGYRGQVRASLSVDVAAFYNRYRELGTGRPVAAVLEEGPPPGVLVLQNIIVNGDRARTYGTEATATWSATEKWKLSGSYSWLRVRLWTPVASGSVQRRVERGSPQHQGHLRSYLDIARHWNVDAALYAVSALWAGTADLPQMRVPAYVRLDARLGWRPSEQLELSVGVQNLLEPRHPEFYMPDALVVPGNQVGRSAYGKIAWRF